MSNKRLLKSLSFIDDQYVKEAEPKMKKSKSTNPFLNALKYVASFAVVIALSLYLFIPYSKTGPDVTAYAGSEYFPIIERISDYSYNPSPFDNNFEYIANEISDLIDSLLFGMGGAKDDMMASPDSNGSHAPESSGNGNYVESTDNQVEGVVEADLMKRTDKYIFRLSPQTLYVYSIDKENSTEVARFDLPGFADEWSYRGYNREMYLSEDAETVTVISPYTDKSSNSKIRILSIDVSDISNITLKKSISIDGSLNSTRMVDGRLLLISEFYAYVGSIDYANPETFVPTITDGEKTECIKFEDIIYPDEIGSTRYSVVALIDEDSLSVIRAQALLDFYDDIYVSENNVYVTNEYVDEIPLDDNGRYAYVNTSDIAVLNYAGETLEYRGILTAEGYVKDQYSMDEYEGHFRVVTSTSSYSASGSSNSANMSSEMISRSASLTVFNLDSLAKIAEVKDFAPYGEEAASVRFDGDTAYVCTAVIVTFKDPVYYFDLSDYSNITYTDTGVIEGFSSSLIQLGEGFLLGIGEENWEYGKVEVYEERDGKVVSVDKYLFAGDYSTNYKSYYVDRDTNTFGFCAMYLYDAQTHRGYNAYILLVFNGYELIEVAKIPVNNNYDDRIRAFVEDGYLYITDDDYIIVEFIG